MWTDELREKAKEAKELNLEIGLPVEPEHILALLDVVDKANRRIARGCNDTCANILNPKYKCDCGWKELVDAISRLKELDDDKE